MIKKEDDMLANASNILNNATDECTDWYWVVCLVMILFGGYGFCNSSTNELEKRLSKVEGQIDVLKNK